MSDRKEYRLNLIINNRRLSRVIIDQHYKLGHPEMNDELILELVKTQNELALNVQEEKDGYQYFAVEPVEYKERPYRLILLLCTSDNFLGVINAFRVKRR